MKNFPQPQYFLLIALMFLFMNWGNYAMADLNLSETKLDNGLSVIFIENHTVPLVTIQIVSKNGSYTETPDTNGLSHLYEHMFFKGNKVITNQTDYKAKIRELGIAYNGVTTMESVRYYFTLPSYNLEKGLQFMNDAIRFPLFDKQELEKERNVVLEEYNRKDSNSYSILLRDINSKLFGTNFYKVNVIGDRNIIATATREKMIGIQNKFYTPGNCALILAGDINKEDAMKLIKKIFNDWPVGSGAVKHPVINHEALKSNYDIVVNQQVKNAELFMRMSGPSPLVSPKSVYSADLLSKMVYLPTSKIYKKLVDSQILLDIYFSNDSQMFSPSVSFSATVNPDKVLEAKKALLEEINKIADPSYFTDEEIERAKKAIEVKYLYEQEDTQEFSLTLGHVWATNGLSYYRDYLDNINKVTQNDIIAFCKDYIIARPYVFGIMISKENQEKYGIK